MADELVDKGIDAEEVDDEGVRPGRRKLWWVIAVGALAAVVGTLAITRPWSDATDDDPSSSATLVTVARPPDAEPIEPELSGRLVLGDVPKDMSISWISDGADMVDDFGDAQTATNVLLAAGGANALDGPWLSATVVLLDQFERRDFDPGSYITAEASQPIRVGDLTGAFSDDNFNLNSELIFGPVNDGYMVSLSAEGLTDAELKMVAEELQLDEETDRAVAWPVFGPAAAELELDPLASFEQPNFGFGIGAPFAFLLGQSPTSTDVTYAGSNDGVGVSVVNSVPPAGVDVMALARFVLGDAEEVTVHGQPALRGPFNAGFGADIVVWLEGGRIVMVVGSQEDLDLVALAESVREADDDEWAALSDEVNNFEGEFGGGPQDTWMIGAGDMEDSSTWVIEGEVDADGDLSLCTTFMRPNESGSGCPTNESPDLPGLTPVGDLSFGAGPTALGFVATVANDELATLRFTGADGSVIDVPLAAVRADWPFLASAIVVEQPGLVEIIAADGSVLVSEEITQDDLDAGGFG